MAAENWEKLNPGSVVNWGQVEMIYDLRNVLTLYTIIQTTVSIGLSNLWNQIDIGIFQKMSSSRGRTHGRSWWAAEALSEHRARFSSHTLDQLPSKLWLIVIQRRDGIGSMPRKFHLSGIWQEEKKRLKISEEAGICPSYSVSVFTQPAHVSKLGSLKISGKCFSINRTSSLVPSQCSPRPQTAGAFSRFPHAFCRMS